MAPDLGTAAGPLFCACAPRAHDEDYPFAAHRRVFAVAMALADYLGTRAFANHPRGGSVVKPRRVDEEDRANALFGAMKRAERSALPSSDKLAWHLTAVRRELLHNLLVQPDVH